MDEPTEKGVASKVGDATQGLDRTIQNIEQFMEELEIRLAHVLARSTSPSSDKVPEIMDREDGSAIFRTIDGFNYRLLKALEVGQTTLSRLEV